MSEINAGMGGTVGQAWLLLAVGEGLLGDDAEVGSPLLFVGNIGFLGGAKRADNVAIRTINITAVMTKSGHLQRLSTIMLIGKNILVVR